MKLRGVKALASLPDDELAEIEPYLEYREYQPGSEIVHFGSKADDMYLVLLNPLCAFQKIAATGCARLS